MTAINPWAIQANSHPASTVRQAQQGQMGSPVGSFAGGVSPTTGGGGHGVCGANDLLVTANGTPNMSVNVAQGLVAIRGTESQHQGVYGPCYNDGAVNLVIAAADPTNGRKDLICAKIRDAQYSGGANDFSLVVVTGTPAGSPADPTPPANSVVLARVQVDAAVSSIVAGKITDLRPRAATLGGVQACTSTTRPTGAALYAGLVIYELNTARYYRYTGAAWSWLRGGTNPTACRAYATGATSCTGGASTKILFGALSYDYGSNYSSDYVAPEAGDYEIFGRTGCAGQTTSERIFASIYVNGVEVARGVDITCGTAGATGLASTVRCRLALNASDVVTLRLFTSVTHNSDTGSSLSYLEVLRA